MAKEPETRAASRDVLAPDLMRSLLGSEEERRANLAADTAAQNARIAQLNISPVVRRHAAHTLASAADDNVEADPEMVGDAVFARPYGSPSKVFEPETGRTRNFADVQREASEKAQREADEKAAGTRSRREKEAA